MTCLYLLRVFPVLSETFILSQITGLLDRGVDVRIVAMARPPEQTSVVHEQVQAYDLQERTTYLHDPATGPLARLRPAEVLQNPALAARVLRPWRYGNKAINGSLLHLAARWREQGLTPSPDVVVAHFGPVGELAVCLRDAGVFDGPVVTPIHGNDISTRILRGQPIYPRLRRWGDLTLPISRRWREALLNDGYPAERVDVHHVGVAASEEAPTRPEPDADAPIRILSVGRFVEKKGFADAIEAVARLVERGARPLRYTVVGYGPEADALHAVARERGLGEIVTFTGPLSQEAVQAAYAEHDVFLAPSVTSADGDMEGIPTVLMEAMAAGLVPISTFHSGIPELVEDGVHGRLVPERDPVALADALLDVLDHPDRWPGYRRAAWEKVRAEFAIETLNDQLLARLERVRG